jgi:transcriptional regulator PpsR
VIALPDITLRLDQTGVIREATLANAISGEAVDGWVGRPWAETVRESGGGFVRRMVEDARSQGVSTFRQVTQLFPSGLELPIEYNAVRLGGKAGLIAVGKNLQMVAELQARVVAAQQAREQDYWKLREIETRYRLLFDATHDPVVMVAADGLTVLEANPAAIRHCGFVVGWELQRVLAPEDHEPLKAMLARVQEQGRAPSIRVHLGAELAAWTVRATPAASRAERAFLLQFSGIGAVRREPPRPAPGPGFEPLIDRLPDGFVLVDGGGVVRRANRAFLDLVQAPEPAAVIGEPLGRWLAQPGADAGVLLATVRRHHSVRIFPTTIVGELGTEAQVEISAAADAELRPRVIGAIIRDVGPRLPGLAPVDELGGLLAGMGDRIGRVPLLELIREAGGVIERHYIEAALRRSNGNRTVAADLLGLSRQSLYAKLARHGIDGDAATAVAAGDTEKQEG